MIGNGENDGGPGRRDSGEAGPKGGHKLKGRSPVRRYLRDLRERLGTYWGIPRFGAASVRALRALLSFWGLLAVTVTIVSGVISVMAYIDLRNPPEAYLRSQSGGFTSTVIQASGVHFGDRPGASLGEGYRYVGTTYEFSFDCPELDPRQMAILTFEVFAVRATRHFELNGVLLPNQPQVVNQDTNTWDTIVIIIARDILKPTDNRLIVTALNEDGLDTGLQDDFLLRNMTVLYKPHGSA